MITKIINGKILTDRIETDKYLYIENEKILAVTKEEIPSDLEINADGNYISPGFIDIHTHGGGGADFMDGSCDDIYTALAAHLHGNHLGGIKKMIDACFGCSFFHVIMF